MTSPDSGLLGRMPSAAHSQAPVHSVLKQLRRHGFLIASLVLLVCITCPFTIGDTALYASQIISYHGRSPIGDNSLIWELGHLLWRPLGWAILEVSAPVFERFFHWDLRLLCTAILMAVSASAGFASVLIWHSLALSVTASRAVAYGLALAFACANAFLSYMRSGSSYVPGLFFAMLSVWIVWRAARRKAIGPGVAWAGGLALAAGVLFWLPYVLSLPGVVFLGLRRQAAGGKLYGWANRENVKFAGHFLGTFLIGIILCSSFALAARHTQSMAEGKAWADESRHGWSQNRTAMRIVTGLPRSFFYMGRDGVLYKRFLWKDPYNPVSLSGLVRASLWKLALFYVFGVALLLELLIRSDNHHTLAMLFAGAVPTIWFAVFVFEPGSAERYFPMYPFLILALAQALRDFPRSHRLTQSLIVAFLVGMVATNAYSTYRPRITKEELSSTERVAPLKQRLGDEDFVTILNNQDSLYQFANRSPFDPVNQPRPIQFYDAIEPGNVRLLRWRQDFAQLSLRAWGQRGEVWVSKRLWASMPLPDWEWVEGDDRHVSWQDIPQFFRQLQIAEDLGGTDGFFRLSSADRNVSQLKSFAEMPAQAFQQR